MVCAAGKYTKCRLSNGNIFNDMQELFEANVLPSLLCILIYIYIYIYIVSKLGMEMLGEKGLLLLIGSYNSFHSLSPQEATFSVAKSMTHAILQHTAAKIKHASCIGILP